MDRCGKRGKAGSTTQGDGVVDLEITVHSTFYLIFRAVVFEIRSARFLHVEYFRGKIRRTAGCPPFFRLPPHTHVTSIATETATQNLILPQPFHCAEAESHAISLSAKMSYSQRLREKRSSEGSIWSKVSFLFRVILCVGILPMIFPESQAFANLSFPSSSVAAYNRAAEKPTLPDQWMSGYHASWITKRSSAGRASAGTRGVDRIPSRSGCRSRTSRYSERQPMAPPVWLIVVCAACFLWMRYHRWRLLLSVGFMMAHFAFEPAGCGHVQGFALLRNLCAWYTANLDINPILTKSISAGVIGMIGDFAAQFLERTIYIRRNMPSARNSGACSVCSTVGSHFLIPTSSSIRERYHVRRGISMLADGLFISGPLMHFGYELFEAILPIADSTTGPASAIAAMIHVAADSILLDSVFIASRFFTTGLMEGFSLVDLLPQFKSVYVPSLKASWATSLVMCPIQFSCFRYLPLSFRVLSVNFIDVIWDTVLSFMAHQCR